METNKLQMIISDLDKTLLNDNREIGQGDLETLAELGKNNILRAIATGRSLHTALKVLPDETPVDYLIFSSGSGIIDWKTRELIFSSSLLKKEINSISGVLFKMEVDFMLHQVVPENHYFTYHVTGKENPDFYRRCELYKEFSSQLTGNISLSEASQFIVIIPNDIKLFRKLTHEIKKLKVQIIRATSPLDHESIWVEIFPEGVSKGHSVEWLCNKLNIQRDKTLGIGNDYNDIDLLEWTNYSYVVKEAPEELRHRYIVTDSYNNNALTRAVQNIYYKK